MFVTLSLVANGEISIDRYANHTIDKVESHGRFYSDKAPGLSLMAVPVTALLWRWMITVFHDGSRPAAEQWPWGSPAYYLFTYFAMLSTSALITAASVAAMFLVALSVFGSPVGAILVAVAYGFATPMFGWATAFVGHAPAAGLLSIGFACAHFLRSNNAPNPRRDCFLVVAGVACLTWAVVIEYTAAPVAAAVAVYGSRKIISAGDHRSMLVGCALITGFLFLLPLLIYNHLAFGAPWRVGYQFHTAFPGTKVGFVGIRIPRLKVLYEIICGERRGIVPLCPLLFLVPLGVLQMGIRNGQRELALLIVFVVIYYLALNSSYYYWDGGSSTGPRYVTGMLPFACLPLGSVWNCASKEMRAFVLLLIATSLALAVACASTGMFAPMHINHLLLDYLIPGFVSGAPTAVPVYLFGWRSRYFLLCLFSLWICLALMIARQLRTGHRVGHVATKEFLNNG
jgi:hypothetical protein